MLIYWLILYNIFNKSRYCFFCYCHCYYYHRFKNSRMMSDVSWHDSQNIRNRRNQKYFPDKPIHNQNKNKIFTLMSRTNLVIPRNRFQCIDLSLFRSGSHEILYVGHLLLEYFEFLEFLYSWLTSKTLS